MNYSSITTADSIRSSTSPIVQHLVEVKDARREQQTAGQAASEPEIQVVFAEAVASPQQDEQPAVAPAPYASK